MSGPDAIAGGAAHHVLSDPPSQAPAPCVVHIASGAPDPRETGPGVPVMASGEGRPRGHHDDPDGMTTHALYIELI